MITLKIVSKDKEVKFEKNGTTVDTVYQGEYRDGDVIIVELMNTFYVSLKLDDSMEESIVYCPNGRFEFTVPLEYVGECYSQEAFKGKEHRIIVYEPDADEIYGRRNIVLNPYDSSLGKAYPHVKANLVTRGAPCFFARNAIDGVIDNKSHGWYPYHSWAGGARDDLEYFINFGQEVEIDELVFFLRADFPHDTYWQSVDIEFDDGSIKTAKFEMTENSQKLLLDEPIITRKVHLTNFRQVSYPLSWAALSQIQIYGKYIKEDLSKMEIRNASNPKDVKYYTTERLREEFHISKLFTKDNIRMVYSHIDRIITAGIMPVLQELKPEAGKELAADYFLQRREMGCINVGGKGIITIDGTDYELNPRDGIYIGMGNKDITFKCIDPENPPKFYVASCPAHKSYPIVKIDITKAKKVPCGSTEDCNKRVINQYIHPEVMQSCQLAMGLTELEPGSNWNTMPSHTHDRRMEVYMYLDMGPDDAVFHMMGEPNETRHIVMHNEEAVISPSWSIHSGVGTKNYSFIWAMCGENQEFTDMDFVETRDLR